MLATCSRNLTTVERLDGDPRLRAVPYYQQHRRRLHFVLLEKPNPSMYRTTIAKVPASAGTAAIDRH